MAERHIEQVEPIENSREFLSKEHVVRLLYHSFKFSQGNAGLQKDIFRWLSQQYPGYKIDPNDEEEITKELFNRAKKYIFSDKGLHALKFPKMDLIKTDDIENQATTHFRILAKELSLENSKEANDQITARISLQIMKEDVKYLKGILGRNKRRPNKQAPSISHLTHYALEGNSTGLEEYDEMFRQVKGFVLNEYGKLASGHETKIPKKTLNKMRKIVEERSDFVL